MTLLELVVALAVSAMVVVGVAGVVNSQQKAYYGGHRVRGAQSAGRAAILEIERRLLLAGYGMDAPLAFDFDRYAGPCPTEFAGFCARDAADTSDEIVFFHRNPEYWVPGSFDAPDHSLADAWTKEPSGRAWRIVSVDPAANTLHIAARKDTTFYPGQILQAVCKGGAFYTYFTVGAKFGPLAADTDDASVTLSPVGDGTDPFRRQDATTADGCFNAKTARLFQIDRERLHVRPVTVDGEMVPYLVLDQGLDTNGDGKVTDADEIVLVEGVENLQFAYVMTNPALAPRGMDAGAVIAFAGGATGTKSAGDVTTLQFSGTVAPGQNLYRATSWYGYTYGPPPHDTRMTDHQANIRAVRVGLVARFNGRDPDAMALDPRYRGLFNMDALPAWMTDIAGMTRFEFETTVPLRNMAVRGMNDF